jgi:hypothetical protein
MRAHRGKLEFGPGPGDEVFAASFIPRREIVFDTDLLAHAPDFLNIVAHELYHFVWRRLSNAERKAWADLLAKETRPIHAGLSSRLRYQPDATTQSKDYVCEAFCDTAAAFHSQSAKISSERRRYFSHLTDKRRLPV